VNAYTVASRQFFVSRHKDQTGSLSEALCRFRKYLLVLAGIQLGDRPQAKFDASDVVQQTSR